MRRVVRRADRVDVVRLHQLDVAAHDVLGHRAAAVGVPLVAVDAAQQHAAAVDAQLAVLDGDRAEADPQRHRLALGPQLAVVEPRQLGAPRLDGPGRDRLPRGRVDAELGDDARARARRRRRAACRRRSRARTGRRRSRPGGRAARRSGTAPTATTCPGPRGSCPRTTGAPCTSSSFSGSSRCPTANSCTSRLPYASPSSTPFSHARRCESAPPKRSTASPSGQPAGSAKRAPVLARRVLVRHERRVDRERVGDVRVGGRAVAVQLPVRGHRQLAPGAAVEPERPRPVEREHGGARALPRAWRQGAAAGRERVALRVVQRLQEVVRRQLDLLVPPFGSTVVAGDDPHPVDPAEVAEHERVARLRPVRGAVGEPEVPGRVLVPAVVLEVGVLVLRARAGRRPSGCRARTGALRSARARTRPPGR